MSMIAARTAQAVLAARIFTSLKANLDPSLAGKILTEAIQADAMAAGQAFAGQAPDGPNLKHFATVLERWREDNALVIEDVELSDDTLNFVVTNCAYARVYAEISLEPELGFMLSCARDEPFAHGYSPCLDMQRSETIMQGRPCCRFTFTWRK
ncbi:L-2-amino-thiazoline-4-carboxylic acid hydrolase [Desulfomicrobium apsheronum]|nr:L-2-amino-thiazoline-4-carboxylic acid hydrolase [Desulfomicrobium apsheronum]